jgi:cytochrome c-type biogenesis protein CcmF
VAWESYLLYAALALYASGSVAFLLKRSSVGRATIVLAAVPSIGIFLSYWSSFLNNDFSLVAVFQDSSASLPVPFKMVAALSGAGGSLILWLALMSIALMVYELWNRKPSVATSLIVTLYAVYVLIALVFINPFASTGFASSNGLGLTPSLQSYWALIHPPTVFTAYTAMIFLFASAISQRWKSQDAGSWRVVNGRLLAGTWLLLGAGITLGGMWAYQTEGWGGFWAWDPIETSALVPWIALTAIVLSSQMGSRLRSGHTLLGVTFAASTLSFTSYVARGAGAPSVHSYGDIVTGAPFIVLCLFPILIAIGSLRQKPTPVHLGGIIQTLEFWCVMLLAAANFMLLLGEEFLPVFGMSFVPNEGLHNVVSVPFVLGALGLLTFESLLKRPRSQLTWASIGAGTVFCVALALAFYSYENAIFDLVVSFAALSLVVGVYSLAVGGRHGSSFLIMKQLAVVGLSVLLIGVAVSSGLRTSMSAEVQVGQSASLGGTTVDILNANTIATGRTVYLPPYGNVPESIDTTVGYLLTGQDPQGGTAVLQYYPGGDDFYPVPSIHSSIGGDMYLVVWPTASIIKSTATTFRNGTTTVPTSVDLSLQFIPGVSFVWLGVAILLASCIPAIVIAPRKEESKS